MKRSFNPPRGRGPQVENPCFKGSKRPSIMEVSWLKKLKRGFSLGAYCPFPHLQISLYYKDNIRSIGVGLYPVLV